MKIWPSSWGCVSPAILSVEGSFFLLPHNLYHNLGICGRHTYPTCSVSILRLLVIVHLSSPAHMSRNKKGLVVLCTCASQAHWPISEKYCINIHKHPGYRSKGSVNISHTQKPFTEWMCELTLIQQHNNEYILWQSSIFISKRGTNIAVNKSGDVCELMIKYLSIFKFLDFTSWWHGTFISFYALWEQCIS